MLFTSSPNATNDELVLADGTFRRLVSSRPVFMGCQAGIKVWFGKVHRT